MQRARIEHQLPGRCRLRLLEHQSDEYFAQAKRALESCAGVLEVSVRPTTSSVLVFHEGALERVLRFAEERELFALSAPEPEPPRSPLRAIADELDHLDRELRDRTEGKWGLGSLAFYGLMAATGLQITKGNLFPAASTLLYQALHVLRDVVEEELPRKQGR